MPNPEIAALIGKRFATGLPHPGDPQNHMQASVIKLPGFNTAGMAPDQAEKFVGKLGQLLGEAIVNLIESEGNCDLVPRAAKAKSA
jgi:hypothetical protein